MPPLGFSLSILARVLQLAGAVLIGLSLRSCYQDLGSNYFDERDRQGAVRRIERLGLKVTLEAA